MPSMSRRSRHRGFTLVEILMTFVLVGILAAIAVPSYSAYILRGQRVAAKTALLQVAEFLERNYTASGCYNYNAAGCAGGAGAAGAVAVGLPAGFANAPTDASTYTYAVQLAFPGDPAPSQGFTVTATPCAAAGNCPPATSNTNYADPECGTFSLDNTGVKLANGTVGAINPDRCWQR
jgi:type IV pilus assembly protein PilE